MESEFVEVLSELKGHVIGKSGIFIKGIMKKSGARISSEKKDEGFTVSGNADQRACAKSLILEKVQEIQRWRTTTLSPGELVEIPTEYKGLVIGTGGDNLRNISTKTGAKVIRKNGEVYIVSGNKQQRQQVKLHIGKSIVGARLRGEENKFNKVCCFIDAWNLTKNSELKLEQVWMWLPGSEAQYRLKPAEGYEVQESDTTSDDSSHELQIRNDALEALRKIKHKELTEKFPKADMWCHFGTGIIQGPDEEEAEGGEWSIDEAMKKLQSPEEGNHWKVTFKEGVDLDEKVLEGTSYEKTSEDFIARYDLTYVTPCWHEIRCKVWVTQNNANKRLEDIPIPFNDVKNILEEIHFEDELTRSRCRGWLVLPSRRYLQADILFPGCEFDCRFTIRGRTDCALVADYAPKAEARHVLSRHLSGLTLTDGDPFELSLPDNEIPEGFHLIHKRSSKRAMYTTNPEFAIILSKEISWHSDIATEELRESTDLHLHCKEWDKLLSSKDWEPEVIVERIPEFFRFVKQVQGFVAQEIKGRRVK
ncbi:uncharacterized protein LOC110060719 isoform X2 [Orbicella faveolata]|nr:uncharacterized protein LOC110060719 isoform X2 [Orbicella faveolata]XP_020623173.1 uncharacterized protein LOC110060719 isoform X2 [Orbicella faveolata]XP_020623174.1 uncharacterized protein LOC110060719 isoform X2 [Orbicella faveolata]